METETSTYTVPSDAAVRLNRFNPDGPSRYHRSGDGQREVRETREEAVADWIAHKYGIPCRNIAGDLLVACSSCRLPVYDSHHDGLCGACR